MNFQSQYGQQQSLQLDDSINGFQDSLQLQQCFEKFQDESLNNPLKNIPLNGLTYASEKLVQKQNPQFEKAYYCQVENCQKEFNNYFLLKDHMRMHKQQIIISKFFIIVFVNKIFNRNILSQQLISKQNKEKQFQCPYCSQSFSQKQNLKRHLRIHTNEKPFVCSICKKAFNTSSNLKQHQQIHLKEKERKQFKCDVEGCNKFYFYASNLKKHKQTHELEKQKAEAKLINNHPQISCKIENQAQLQLYYNTPQNKSKEPIIIINNGQLSLLINSLLYNLNDESECGHELENTDINPFNEYECNPLQEITHWNSLEELKQVYMKIENDSKANGGNINYQMLINQNNCNSFWCTCHAMTEHNNWQNCVNNPLKFCQQQQQLTNSNSISLQSNDFSQLNGLCLCQETKSYKHKHSNHCGHMTIRHAGHIDYLVGNVLHFPHGEHCDSHGTVQIIEQSQLSASEIEALKVLEQKIYSNLGITKEEN